jgi:hypothetical protein
MMHIMTTIVTEIESVTETKNLAGIETEKETETATGIETETETETRTATVATMTGFPVLAEMRTATMIARGATARTSASAIIAGAWTAT